VRVLAECCPSDPLVGTAFIQKSLLCACCTTCWGLLHHAWILLLYLIRPPGGLTRISVLVDGRFRTTGSFSEEATCVAGRAKGRQVCGTPGVA